MYPPTGHSLGNGCFVFPPGWYWIATLSGLMWTLFFQIVNLNGCWQHSHFNGHIFAAMSATGQKKRRAFGQGLEQEKRLRSCPFKGQATTSLGQLEFMSDGLAIICWLCAACSSEWSVCSLSQLRSTNHDFQQQCCVMITVSENGSGMVWSYVVSHVAFFSFSRIQSCRVMRKFWWDHPLLDSNESGWYRMVWHTYSVRQGLLNCLGWSAIGAQGCPARDGFWGKHGKDMERTWRNPRIYQVWLSRITTIWSLYESEPHGRTQT